MDDPVIQKPTPVRIALVALAGVLALCVVWLATYAPGSGGGRFAAGAVIAILTVGCLAEATTPETPPKSNRSTT